jgi:uncharacterized membrane protein YcaP (DUF421 family)
VAALQGIDVAALFRLTVPVAEIVLRGSAIYVFLFLIFRFVIRRDVGSVGIADVLLLVLVADASQNAMAGEYTTVSEGLVLVSTLIGWNVLLDWLAFRYPAVRRFVEPTTLPLVRDGRLLRRNMRREFITEEELLARLREQGVEDLAQVKAAYLEPDGNFSVIRR